MKFLSVLAIFVFGCEPVGRINSSRGANRTHVRNNNSII
jgi:hypothetical protein